MWPTFSFGILSLIALLPSQVLAGPCVVFDTYFNLYAFGVQGTHSWKFGQQKTWGAGAGLTITDVAAEGRPKFDGSNTQCYLAQYFNVIYVTNGDAANPNDIHIYDATINKWTTQKTDVASGANPSKFTAILDHDTNVFFALSEGKLYSLLMETRKAATPNALPWVLSNPPNFNTQGYQPLMGIAKNHIHFLNVPGSAAGQANIFVIHFAYFQPQVQFYAPRNGQGSTFPATHGKVASIFAPSDASKEQRYFAFIPDTKSQTYVVDVQTNTTSSLPPPTVAEVGSQYAGSDSALVQLTPGGQLYYLPFNYNTTTTTATAWTLIPNPKLTVAAPTLPPVVQLAKATVTQTASAKPSASSSAQRQSASLGVSAGIAFVFASVFALLS